MMAAPTSSPVGLMETTLGHDYGACQTTTKTKAAAYSWVIAVAFCVGGAIISNLGVNLQKMAHTRKQSGRGSYRALWLIGFVGITGGAIGDFAALGFGAESVVAPLGSMTLVANVVLAPLLLKEVISKSDLVNTFLIVAGCVLAVAFASHKDCLYTLDALFALYRTAAFGIYASTITVIILVWLVVIRWMERRLRVYGEGHRKYRSVFKFHRFSYAAISGIVGSQSILFAKTSVELVMDSARGGTLFLLNPLSYLILLAMGSTVTLQIYWLNCGLARWEALYNVPVFQAFWILVSVVGGGVFYREFQGFTPLNWLMFPAGVLLTVVGVIMLSQRDTTKVQEAKEKAETATAASTVGESLLAADAQQAIDEPQQETVVFNDRQLGLTLRPRTIKIVANPKYPTVKTLVNAWVVTGFARLADGSVSPAETSGKLRPGDIVAAVNNDGVLIRWIAHTDVLKRLQDSPRPVAITFLRPPSRQRTGRARRRGSTVASAASETGGAVVHVAGTAPSGARAGRAGTQSSVGSATGARTRAGTAESIEVLVAHGEAAGVHFDSDLGSVTGVSSDEDEPLEVVVPSSVGRRSGHRGSIRNSHRSLQHVSMDPLAGLLHTGQMIGPSLIDKDDSQDTASHPLVHFMDTVFPEGGKGSMFMERIVDVVDPDAGPIGRRNSIGDALGPARRGVSSVIKFLSPRSSSRRRARTAQSAAATAEEVSSVTTPLSRSIPVHLSHGAVGTSRAAPLGSEPLAPAPAPPSAADGTGPGTATGAGTGAGAGPGPAVAGASDTDAYGHAAAGSAPGLDGADTAPGADVPRFGGPGAAPTRQRSRSDIVPGRMR